MGDSIYKTHKPASGGDLYLKIKDGQKVRMRIISDPAVSTYDGIKLRYNWVVVNRETGTAHVYQAGGGIFKDVAALVDDWGDPRDFDISVSRTGSTQNDTKYTVNPVPPSKTTEPTEEQLEEAAKINLLEASKGKMLADYEEDGIMPAAIDPNAKAAPATEGIEGEDFSLADVPPELGN